MNSRALAGALILLAGYWGQPVSAASPPAGNSRQTAVIEAVDLQIGSRYEAGTRLRVAIKGLSFVIPQYWSGRIAEGDESLRLTSDTKPGIGLVYMVTNIKPQELAARLADSQELPDGVILQLAAPVRTIGSRSTAFYREGDLIGRALAISGPSENAVIYVIAGPHTQRAYYERLLEELAASTSFTKIGPEELRKIWHELLAGMMLTRLSSFSAGEGAGGSATSVWHLCRNGSFVYLHSPGATDPSDSEEHRDPGSGAWRVQMKGRDPFLVLTGGNRLQTVHSLEYDGVKTYLDEAQVSRVPSKRCADGLNR
jgi:hypothetical protein